MLYEWISLFPDLIDERFLYISPIDFPVTEIPYEIIKFRGFIFDKARKNIIDMKNRNFLWSYNGNFEMLLDQIRC